MDDIRGYFGQVFQTGEGWKANCPACDDTQRKFAWNEEKGVGCCFHSSCRWFYKNGGVTLGRLKSWFTGRGIEHVIPQVIESSEETDVSLPEEFQLIKDLENKSRSDIYAYLAHRGLSKRIVDKAKLGYCEKGKYWGYIILPVFDEIGEVVYWQGRRFKNREPKFWNPKSTKKSDLVYCVSKMRRPKSIVIVESVMNALTLENMEVGKTMIVAILGKSLSEAQRDHILTYERNCNELIIALDGDARRDTPDIAEKFMGIIPRVKIANIPDGEDLNSLGRAKAWQLINNSEEYSIRRRIEFMTRTV